MRSAPAIAVVLAARLTTGSRRLRITNGCSTEPLWIAHQGQGGTGPDPQNVRIEPLGNYDFITFNGLSATRYWPKMGCDDMGNSCSLGGSGGPGEACVRPDGDYSQCAPPVDTKFEATFGRESAPCDPATGSMEGCDYVDVSLVDGFTLPFKLELNGNCNKGGSVIDCSGLSFAHCPTQEYLHAADMVANLQAINPKTNQVVGCYSPCSKLIDDKWDSMGRKPHSPEAAPYCCPTPPQDPEQCRAGPIKDTEFVQTVHRQCPGVYGYSYDDGMGLVRCDATTHYALTFFCPPEPIRHDDHRSQPTATPSFKDFVSRIFTDFLRRFHQPRHHDFLRKDSAPLHSGRNALAVAVAGAIVLAAAITGAVALTMAGWRSWRVRYQPGHRHPVPTTPSTSLHQRSAHQHSVHQQSVQRSLHQHRPAE
mmetsp:Transcript_119877/g.339798  ORF Transcript_119877/g.339798 Transcript_119877/m.339798 type:complete len:422 (-) Transcript_119877:106-1371(-)